VETVPDVAIGVVRGGVSIGGWSFVEVVVKTSIGVGIVDSSSWISISSRVLVDLGVSITLAKMMGSWVTVSRVYTRVYWGSVSSVSSAGICGYWVSVDTSIVVSAVDVWCGVCICVHQGVRVSFTLEKMVSSWVTVSSRVYTSRLDSMREDSWDSSGGDWGLVDSSWGLVDNLLGSIDWSNISLLSVFSNLQLVMLNLSGLDRCGVTTGGLSVGRVGIDTSIWPPILGLSSSNCHQSKQCYESEHDECGFARVYWIIPLPMTTSRN